MEKETSEIVKSKDRFLELLSICNDPEKPDPEAREELHMLIHSTPNYKKAMQRHEGMYSLVLRARIDSSIFGDTMKEVLYVKCDQLREELGYSSANQLERLAIEQIVLCWINHHLIEIKHACVLSEPHTTETGLYWEKRLASSNRQYIRAIELLSKMRKMKLVVQINNADKQIINNGSQ